MRNFWAKCVGISRKLGFLSLPLFFLALVFLDGAFRLVYSFTGVTQLSSWKPAFFTLGWALLLTALVSLLPRLGRRIAMGVLGALFAFLAVLHGVMYNLFGHFFSFSDMNFAGDGAKFFSWTYLRLPKKYVFFILVFLLMVAAAIFLSQKPRPSRRAWLRPVVAVALAILSVVPMLYTSWQLAPKEGAMTWDFNYKPGDEREIYKEFTDPNRSINLTGIYQYTVRNLAVSMGWGIDRKSIEELDEYFDQRAAEISGENDLTKALEGKNLIMIMLESADSWFVTPDYMPNFYRLQQEGVDLANFYTPLFLSGGTFNTEIISQLGQIPPVAGVSNRIYSTNSFPLALANLFADKGYTVNSFHSAYPSIYSRGTVHANLGFEAYHCFEDMGMNNYKLDSQLLNAYEQFAPRQEEPFFSFIITYSGHGPYTEEQEDISEPHLEAAREAVARAGVTSSAANMEEYTRAVAQMTETDQFIGGLADRLEQEGRLEDTVLLLYADHYVKYISDKEFLNQVKGVSVSPELYHTPCVLYGGGLQAQSVEKFCASVDLAPTLVNLFGLAADRKYFAGDDIFGDKGGVVMMPNDSWYDGKNYFAAGAADPDPEMTARLKRRVTMSMESMKSDYFQTWE